VKWTLLLLFVNQTLVQQDRSKTAHKWVS